MPMNMPDFALPVTSELSLPRVYGTAVVCLFAFLLYYVACSVSKSFCFHPNGQHLFCRLRNHDYDMAINLMISDHVIRQSVWRLAARTSRFLPPFVFVLFFFFFFLRLYSVRAAIDSDTRSSYTRLHPVQQTNLQLS